jgi:transposase
LYPEPRDTPRTSKQLVREISQHSSRTQKILEDANLKLGSVLSNVLGKSGRAILHALIAGETNPELADFAERRRRGESRTGIHVLIVLASSHTLRELW